MRVLTIGNMYPPHQLGGYELTWRSAVMHLRARGHDVRVLTTDYRHPTPERNIPEDPEAYRELRWYWRDHAFPRLSIRERMRLERHNARILKRHLDAFGPDVVSWWAMGGMSQSLLEHVAAADLPSVGVVGDDWMLYGPKVDSWMRLSRRLGLAGRLLGALSGIPTKLDLGKPAWLFNSEATRRHAYEHGLVFDHAEVVYPGIDTDLFRSSPVSSWSWQLLYVGRIDERKGIDTAVEALDQLPEAARLTVLGSGDEGVLKGLRERSEDLGLSGRVNFGLLPREALPRAYAEADALLFPVRWEEPWGLVPLEAMAVGTPVIATGTGGSSEYLEDGENSLVVGRGAGPGEFAAAVRRLAKDEELRRRLRRGGLETAARYSERDYNRKIASALERAAKP